MTINTGNFLKASFNYIKRKILLLIIICLSMIIAYLLTKQALQKVSYNHSMSESDIVNNLNNLPITFSGYPICQTEKEVMKNGGRICYYIYSFAQPSLGNYLLPFAFKRNAKNNIIDIYFGAATKKDKPGQYVNIGGFFDPIDNAKLSLTDDIKNPIEEKIYVEINKGDKQATLKHFSKKLYQQAILNRSFVNPQQGKDDQTPISSIIREIKEELNWLIESKDFLSRRPIPTLRYIGKDEGKHSLIGNYYLLYLGDLDNEGNLTDKKRNIKINNYKALGYDDIETVDFISFLSLSKDNEFYYLKGVKVPIKSFENIYRDLIKAAIIYAAQKDYNINLYNLKKEKSVDDFFKDPLNPSNFKTILLFLNSYKM